MLSSQTTTIEYCRHKPLMLGAHWCWVMKPWLACSANSSAPLNRKITECLLLFGSRDKIRNVSSITQQFTALSLAPICVETNQSINFIWPTDRPFLHPLLPGLLGTESKWQFTSSVALSLSPTNFATTFWILRYALTVPYGFWSR